MPVEIRLPGRRALGEGREMAAAAAAAASVVSLPPTPRACRHSLAVFSAGGSSFSLFSRPNGSSRLRSPAVGISLGRVRRGPVAAASGDAVPSEALVEGSQKAVAAATDDATTTIISVLLFIAFVGLSILTVGVFPCHRPVIFSQCASFSLLLHSLREFPHGFEPLMCLRRSSHLPFPGINSRIGNPNSHMFTMRPS